MALYDKQLERLEAAHFDKWVSTSFGRTHLIETGNLAGIPLLVFHGGNATSAYNLLACNFLMKDFHIYAVDTIGHPGKSAKLSIDYSKVKAGMPGNVAEKDMKKCKAPTLVMAGEKDCLFPAEGVLPRAERMIENVTTYLLEGRGHMSSLTEQEKQMITEFLKRGRDEENT